MDISQFIQLSVDRHLCCLQFEADRNKTALNIQGEIFVWTYVFIFGVYTS